MISYRPSDETKKKLQKLADERIWSLNKATDYIVNRYFDERKAAIKGKA